MNQQLAMHNRKLAMRSACFEMMTRFYQRIVPAASPAQLLSEIGNVAHQFLDSPRLVLFSQDPNQTLRGGAGEGAASDGATIIGDVLTYDPTQSVQDSFLMSMPPYGGDHRLHGSRVGQDFIRPAHPQFDWLLDRVQAFLGTSQCWFMPLLCGNEPVGGILWVAKHAAAPEGSLAGPGGGAGSLAGPLVGPRPGGRADGPGGGGGNSMAEVADLLQPAPARRNESRETTALRIAAPGPRSRSATSAMELPPPPPGPSARPPASCPTSGPAKLPAPPPGPANILGAAACLATQTMPPTGSLPQSSGMNQHWLVPRKA